MSKMSKAPKCEGHEDDVHYSSESKVFFPESDLTKGDVLEYYEKIAPTMLPYLHDRPISMQRFPDGLKRHGFYQKNASEHFPDWIDTVAQARKDGKDVNYVVCQCPTTLMYLANQAVLTLHPWLSRLDNLDMMVFDLDPSTTDFDHVRLAAQRVHDLMVNDFGVTPFIKTTGSKGLHVIVPLDGAVEYEEVKVFARDVGCLMAARYPDDYTLEMLKKNRGTKLFWDYLRNEWSATAVAPYSIRARAGAPVATPIHWDEVADPELRSDTYTIENIFDRLAKVEDPWKDYGKTAYNIPKLRPVLDALLKEARG